MVPFANVLQPLIDAAEGVMRFFHDTVGLGWGLSIIALTVTVRLLLLPLTLKQAKSMRRMQVLSPQIKELQSKYKGDKQRLNQEMMKFYSENKVNPLASCLPLVLQMPFFISLFYMLRKDLRHDICPAINPANVPNPKPCGASDAAQFLFIPDLTNRATGAALLALLVMYVGSQLASSLLMTVTADKNQRRLFMAMPLVFVAFIVNFPAGLIVYWITTNLWTVGQQFLVRRTVGPPVPPVPGTPGQNPFDALKELFGRDDAAAEAPTRTKARDGASAGARAAGRPSGANGSGSTKRQPQAKPDAGGVKVAAAPPPAPRKKKKRSGRRR